MPQKSVVVASSVGLHARPASLFSQAAAQTGIAVQLTGPSGKSVNAASILGVLSLGVDYGQTVTLSAEGEGAQLAIDTLVSLLEKDLERE